MNGNNADVIDKQRREELMKLKPGELVLVLLQEQGSNTQFIPRLDLNLGILNDNPKKAKYGRVILPMEKYFESVIDNRIEEFKESGSLIHGFYSSCISIYGDTTERLHEQFNQWEGVKRSMEIGSFEIFDFIRGDEIHKKFWLSNAFKNDSGLDLSYVIALKKLGADIPPNMIAQYMKDVEQNPRIIELLEKNKAGRQKVDDETSLLDSILLKKHL